MAVPWLPQQRRVLPGGEILPRLSLFDKLGMRQPRQVSPALGPNATPQRFGVVKTKAASTPQQAVGGSYGNATSCTRVPLTGLEPAHTAPEAAALSN